MKLVLGLLLLAAPLAAQTRTDSTVVRDSVPVAWKITERTRVVVTTTVRDTPIVVQPPVVNPPVPGVSSCLATDLLCEDFEDGAWYEKNCDVARASGGLGQTDGWCGTIYNAAGLSAGTARCGNVGVKSNCAGTTGVMSGGTTGNMADKALTKGVSEMRVRFYTKPLTGYTFGAEKMLTFNKGNAGDGGIWNVGLSWNCASSASSTGKITLGTYRPDRCGTQNLGNALTITAGNWYFYEIHYKLNDPGQNNGVFELWLDNCGPTGTTCPATPTLRLRYADLGDRSSASELISVLWFEAWSNPVSRGERYWDQIVAREGNTPIGAVK